MSANGADAKGLVFESVTLCRLKKATFCDGKICRLKKPTQKSLSLVVTGPSVQWQTEEGPDAFTFNLMESD